MMAMDKAADLIVKNAEVYSVDLKNILTISDAFAVSDGHFVYVGSNQGVERFHGDNTKVLDLDGRTVIPGLADAHLHASMTAEQVYDFSLYGIRLDGAYDRKALITRYRDAIREGAARNQNPHILRGVGWNPSVFDLDPLGQPTADDLSGIADDLPIMLRYYDHHFIWVNRKALELSSIDRNTETPRNGVIHRDANGDPTGVFQESTAIDLLLARLPHADYTVDEYKNGILHYAKKFGNNYGTTLIFDAFNSRNGMRAYEELARNGALTLHVNTCFYADPSLPASQFDEMVAKKDAHHVGDTFNVGSVKFFMDGSGLSFFLSEPFEKAFLEKIGMDVGYRGYPQWTQTEINDAFLLLTMADFQIHVHCMGDEATKMTLDAFEYVAERQPVRGFRHTITHLMQVRDEDIQRIRDLGVVCAMQPMWSIYDRFMDQVAVPMFGRERILAQYPIGSLLKAGCIVSAGTDFPITIPPNPFIGMQTGILRTVPKSHPDYTAYHDTPLGPSDDPMKNAATLKDMVASYTIKGAYQCFQEKVTGSIEAGKNADFVILDRTLTKTPLDELENIHAERTYFKGNAVYIRLQDEKSN
jgi:predicted amidohydrolase YtcJ